MKKRGFGKWVGTGLVCCLLLIGGLAANATDKKVNDASPPLTTNLDTGTQSTTLLDPADVRLCGAGCTGFAGTTTIITTDSLPTLSFQLTNGGTNTGEAYLAILVPAGNSLPTFTVNGNGATSLTSSTYSSGAFTDFLDANVGNLSLAPGGGVNADFGAFASAAGQTITAPTSFSVFVYDLGAFNGTPLTITFASISGFPAGTIFWGFLTNTACSSGPCTLTDTTPLSEAVTVAPEPGTLALVGSGLLLLGGALRRKLAL
jgi:hypothetical protein